jgi:hypothetical protein
MNHYEIATAIGEVLGFEVRYVPLEIDEFRLRMEKDLQFPPFMVQHLCEVAMDYRNGIFAGTDDIIERVTGEPPMTVQTFISSHKDAFSGPDYDWHLYSESGLHWNGNTQLPRPTNAP